MLTELIVKPYSKTVPVHTNIDVVYADVVLTAVVSSVAVSPNGIVVKATVVADVWNLLCRSHRK